MKIEKIKLTGKPSNGFITDDYDKGMVNPKTLTRHLGGVTGCGGSGTGMESYSYKGSY